MKQGKALFILVTTAFLLWVCCSGTTDEVLTGTLSSARIFNLDGETPATGATVKIFKKEAVDGEYVSLQITDGDGLYSFGSIPPGVYNIWAQKDSLVTFRNGVVITSDNADIRSDTLKCPSTVCGVIGVQPQDDPLTVTIQVVGLDKYFNNTDKYGRFTMKGMAEGRYTLLLKSTEPHYTPTTIEITVKKCSTDTLRDTLHLTYTGIPVVRGLDVSYDTAAGIVHLNWNSIDYRSFQEYLIYKDFFDSTVYSVIPIDAAEDSVFHDTIFNRTLIKGPFSGVDTNDYHFRYRVAIRNSVNETGQTFKYIDVIAVSPLKLITRISLSTVHVAKGYVTKAFVDEKLFASEMIAGTASVNDSLRIYVHAENRLRTLASVAWMDSANNYIRTKTAATAGKSLDDTLSYFCNSVGMKRLTVVVTDNTGKKTIDTVRIATVEDPPEVDLFSGDSMNTLGNTINKRVCYAIGDSISLHAKVHDRFGAIRKIDWMFGSAAGVPVNTVVFDTFAILPDTACSTYPVVVSVTDDDGNNASDTLWVKVGLFSPITENAAFSGRMYQTGVVFNDRMWLYGGVGTTTDIPKTSFKSFDEVWFSMEGREWTKAQSNIPARSGQAMVVFDNKLWLIGGYASSWGEYRNDVWCSSNGITWKCIADSTPFAPRIFHTVTVFDGRMWVIGGLTRRAKVNDVWSSADGVNWNLVTDSAPFSPRSCHASATFDGKIWLTGGEDSAYNPLNDIWYTNDGVEWTLVMKNAVFSPRQGHSLLVYNDRLWLLEGYGMNSFDMAKDVWNSQDGRTWICTEDNESITPRAFHSSMVFRKRIWVVAGMTRYDACVNDVWRSGNLDEDN